MGISTGSMYFGIIGRTKFTFDAWGKPVEEALQLVTRASSSMNHILVTESTNQLLGSYELVQQPGIKTSKGVIPVWSLQRKVLSKDDHHPFLIAQPVKDPAV